MDRCEQEEDKVKYVCSPPRIDSGSFFFFPINLMDGNCVEKAKGIREFTSKRSFIYL